MHHEVVPRLVSLLKKPYSTNLKIAVPPNIVTSIPNAHLSVISKHKSEHERSLVKGDLAWAMVLSVKIPGHTEGK